jgi:hypothetical protein
MADIKFILSITWFQNLDIKMKRTDLLYAIALSHTTSPFVYASPANANALKELERQGALDCPNEFTICGVGNNIFFRQSSAYDIELQWKKLQGCGVN